MTSVSFFFFGRIYYILRAKESINLEMPNDRDGGSGKGARMEIPTSLLFVITSGPGLCSQGGRGQRREEIKSESEYEPSLSK